MILNLVSPLNADFFIAEMLFETKGEIDGKIIIHIRVRNGRTS